MIRKIAYITIHLSTFIVHSYAGDEKEVTENTTLYLRYQAIKEAPEYVWGMAHLTKLGLSYNQLSWLPESIGNLKDLIELDLGGNQLSFLPKSIGSLGNMINLYLPDNQLSQIPNSIGNLENLIELDLRDNPKLGKLPYSLINAQNLKKIYIDNTLIKGQAPLFFGGLKKIEFFPNHHPITVQLTVMKNLKNNYEERVDFYFQRFKIISQGILSENSSLKYLLPEIIVLCQMSLASLFIEETTNTLLKLPTKDCYPLDQETSHIRRSFISESTLDHILNSLSYLSQKILQPIQSLRIFKNF